MSSEEVINTADIFLREVPNVKINNPTKNVAPHPTVKEEMQILRLSKKSQDMVMETLKYIHGDDFTLNDASSYQDKGTNLSKKYWVGRGNLVVKGCCDYSNSEKEPQNEIDRFKMFALLRLESYGFHKEHCQEALDYYNGDLEESLVLLYEKYFKIRPFDMIETDHSEKELLEQRIDEKGVLESIYENNFKEKVQNSVWVISCKLDYLVNLFHKKPTVKKKDNINKQKKKEKCRNFARGQVCKFGNNCRFSHEEDPKPDETDSHLNNFTFELEIRFPKNTKYPFQSPIVFLKTSAVLPNLVNLHICKRLYQEAENLAENGIPSVYSIIELLRNEDEMTQYLNTTQVYFPHPDESLFQKSIDRNNANSNKPSHHKKGITYKDKQKNLSTSEMYNVDKKLVEQFKLKQNEPTYKRMQASRSNLPAWNFKDNLVSSIKSSRVVIVSGETGCGKSTQVAQYVLDDWMNNFTGEHVEIICTQPRRISAIGVAERVAEERVEKVGNVIGYQIRLETKISSNTRLSFCTTGILLRRLEIDPLISNVTHVIVDEVHERSEESDFLLLVLRDLLQVRPDLKVILMSATLNSNVFSDYFGDVPILEIPGRTFPVDQIFLEQILELSDYVFEENSQYARNVKSKSLEYDMESSDVTYTNVRPKDVVKDDNLKFSEVMGRYNDYSVKTCKNLFLMDSDKINYDLIEHILLWIVLGDHKYPKSGTILVFLPGIAEITTIYDQLACHPEFSPKYGKFLLLPLHSSLTSAEQSRVFEKPKTGSRKIVLSTNIAETSITIDDCIFVIDCGKMKEKHFDSNRNMESLETVWVTRANALQRKGRAGRVTNGVAIHLYTSHRFKHHMLSQPIPEIQRIPLEQLILKIKILANFSEKNIHDVLNKTIEPPVKESIDSSIRRLQNVGALDRDNNLTPLGHHLAALPVDVRIGKLMLFGAIFSCIDSALTIAACLSHKSPFVSPFGKKDIANAKKQKFSLGLSDQMTVLTAYNKFQDVNKKGYIAGLNFAKENYLSHHTLITIADVKYQFLELLVSIGFVPIDIGRRPKSGSDNILGLTGTELNKFSGNTRVLSSILCAALYPNVVKILTPEKSFISSAVGAIPKQLESKDFKFRTKQEQVFLHPSSVLFEIKQFPSPFLVYQEKVKTSKIFIRDCCLIPIIPLVMFSGFDVNVSVHNGCTFVVLDDNWIMFEAEEHKIAEMIKMIREELLDILEDKIKDPLLNIQHHVKGERIISTILHLVMND